VTLRDKHLLHAGSDITLFFDGGQFPFADEGAQELFKNAPLVFLNPLPLVPPPRILILGRGKTSIATEIGRFHHAPVYITILQSYPPQRLPDNPLSTVFAQG
jgi:hypothetical protein